MKELSFNKIKKKIHLKPYRMIVERKDKDYKKEFKHNKLTFYKDYKSKMIWFNSYGIGMEDVKFFEVDEKNFQIKTEKSLIKIEVNPNE